jgi:hypothetical protein
MPTLSLTNGTKIYDGEKTASSTNVAGKSGYPSNYILHLTSGVMWESALFLFVFPYLYDTVSNMDKKFNKNIESKKTRNIGNEN